MSSWLIAVTASGLGAIWFVLTLITRRWASGKTAEAAAANEMLLVHTDAAAQTESIDNVVARASDCAQSLFSSQYMILAYLAEDRSHCHIVRPRGKSIVLGVEEWYAFLSAPWSETGMLTRDMLGGNPNRGTVSYHLLRLSDSLGIDLFVPGVDRGMLVCVAGFRLSHALSENDRINLALWSTSFLPGCVHRVLARHAAQQHALAAEIERASELSAALPSEAHQGIAGRLEWAVYENPNDRLGGGFWNAYVVSDTRLLVIAGEIVAKGLAATMLSIAIRSFCDAQFSQMGSNIEPGRLLNDLNRFMYRSTNPMAMSCLAGVFDSRERRVRYCVAGRMAMVRIRALAGVGFAEPLPGIGPQVGDRLDTNYTPYECDMEPDDVFFLLSEGMGEMWQSNTETAIHLRLRIEGASTRPLDELRIELLDALGGGHNRRRGSTPVVVVREHGLHG